MPTKKILRRDVTTQALQESLQLRLDDAFPRASGNPRYLILLFSADDPSDEEGTVAIVSERGTSNFDQENGVYKEKRKFSDYADAMMCVVQLINGRALRCH